MSVGWLYVMGTNHPDHLKLGFTRRTPTERARELGRDVRYGRFGPFQVLLAEPCAWPDAVERNVHRLLQDRKIEGEVFRVDFRTAKAVIEAATKIDTAPPFLREPRRTREGHPRRLRRRELRRRMPREVRRLANSLAVAAALMVVMLYLFP